MSRFKMSSFKGCVLQKDTLQILESLASQPNCIQLSIKAPFTLHLDVFQRKFINLILAIKKNYLNTRLN